MIKIRLKRMGRRHRPFYRVSLMDVQSPRDGRVIEELGFYDPIANEAEKKVRLNEERIRYWLGQGAQTSDTVADLLKRQGIEVAKK